MQAIEDNASQEFVDYANIFWICDISFIMNNHEKDTVYKWKVKEHGLIKIKLSNLFYRKDLTQYNIWGKNIWGIFWIDSW